MTENIFNLLENNSYPGRGILIGKSEDGTKNYIVYFIMGRSENSRNRIFSYTEDGIRTEAFDPAKLSDPSLIIYHPVRFTCKKAIVTNGDQTDTIRDSIEAGHCIRHALSQREFEPDCPNYTPRISGVVNEDGSYTMSILKSTDGDPSCCCRYYFDYDKPIAGTGHFISTYVGDGNPLPSFKGEPIRVDVMGTIEEYANKVWTALNADNKVSLYACEIDIATGEHKQLILNKNKGE
ncbi:MAG: IMP cyclohydrolase [Oscillospiraceae bacterium]|nr:IMP cyclohydrolase [Oscillospiraceae bacterium]